MNKLRDKSNQVIGSVPMRFSRHLSEKIDWNHRLVGIIGPRGVGKTTLMLQQMVHRFGNSYEALYISLEDFYFSSHSLYQLAYDFRNRGGKCLFVDEVHKQANWSQDLINIFHNIQDLSVVFSGSSVIDMLKQGADFCKNVKTYNLQGLSFREYLKYIGVADLPVFSLEDIINNHRDIALDLSSGFKPLFHFDNYLVNGYYPSTYNQTDNTLQNIEQLLMQAIEVDLNYLEGYDPHNAGNMKQLFYAIAQNAPFKPNILRLSEKVGVHRNTLIVYLFHLEKAGLIQLLYPAGSIISILQKPQSIFLNNSNIHTLLSERELTAGTISKTFFMNQFSHLWSVKKPNNGDFEVDAKWIFEVGTYKKPSKFLVNNPHAFSATDGIEVGSNHTIPLWLFGLLY